MGRKGNNKKRSKPKKSNVSANDLTVPSNFVPEAGPGCHIARREQGEENWILEWEDVEQEEYEGEEIPDIAIDTEEHTLSLCNVRKEYVVAYISVFETLLRDRNGRVLKPGASVGNDGSTQTVTTLIVLCPPLTFAHLCYIDLLAGYQRTADDIPAIKSLQDLRIDSDVQVWSKHLNPEDAHSLPLGFPLKGGPFLCTQGVQGHLTHFFAGNLHAIDFRCPVGSPLLAVADGVVEEVKSGNTLTGIAVSNLFEWNSVMIRVNENGNNGDGPLYVEYVHIDSCSVVKGDMVKKGQVIGTSGSVGFSPEPHLHFAAYRSAEPTASTVLVQFADEMETTFVPEAGKWYNATGEVTTSAE